MSTNLAMVFGPFIGLMALQQWGARPLFILSVIVAFCSLITGLIVKHNTFETPEQTKAHSSFSISSLFEASAVPISIVGSFMAVVYSALLSFVSIYASEIHLEHIASMFFVVYAVILLASRPFTGKWLDQYGPNVISFPCITLFAIGMFILSQSNGAVTFLLSAGLIGIGWGTLFPTFQTIAIQNAEPRKRGLATATFLSIYDTGIALGSFIVGVIASKMDYSTLYCFFSFYILIGLVLFYFLHTKKSDSAKKKTQQQTKVQEI
jgi:MFS family permease